MRAIFFLVNFLPALNHLNAWNRLLNAATCDYVDRVELHTNKKALLSWKQLQNTRLHYMYSKPSL